MHTATYDVHVASWMGNVVTDTSRGQRLPGLGRRDLGQGGGAALRREPAPAGRALHRGLRPGGRAGAGDPAARQGDVLQQLRRRRRGPPGGLRLRRAGRRDHQARQPVRHRGRRRRRRGAPQGARLRPGQRVRRRDRHERPGVGRDGRAGRGDLHRGRRRARLRGRRRRGAGQEEEHPAPRVRARRPRAASRPGRSPAGC